MMRLAGWSRALRVPEVWALHLATACIAAAVLAYEVVKGW